MYLANFLIKKTSGLKFYKLLGTGAGAGFSLYPDFSTYSILCVWDNFKSANDFINNSRHSYKISQKAFSRNDYFLKPVHSHGKWDGINPFSELIDSDFDKTKPIAIITLSLIHI